LYTTTLTDELKGSVVAELEVVQVVVSWLVKKARFRAEAVYRKPVTSEDTEAMARHLFNRFVQEIAVGFSDPFWASLAIVASLHTVRGMAAARMETILTRQASGDLPMWLLPPEAEARYATKKEV